MQRCSYSRCSRPDVIVMQLSQGGEVHSADSAKMEREALGWLAWTTYIQETSSALCCVYISHHLQTQENELVFAGRRKKTPQTEREMTGSGMFV